MDDPTPTPTTIPRQQSANCPPTHAPAPPTDGSPPRPRPLTWRAVLAHLDLRVDAPAALGGLFLFMMALGLAFIGQQTWGQKGSNAHSHSLSNNVGLRFLVFAAALGFQGFKIYLFGLDSLTAAQRRLYIGLMLLVVFLAYVVFFDPGAPARFTLLKHP